jgi:spore cortex formation protein SpoVR/YcgB (stage V sporulation)
VRPEEEIDMLKMQLADAQELQRYWERAGRDAIDKLLDAALDLAEAVEAQEGHRQWGMPGTTEVEVERAVAEELKRSTLEAARYIVSAHSRMKQILDEVSETITG